MDILRHQFDHQPKADRTKADVGGTNPSPTHWRNGSPTPVDAKSLDGGREPFRHWRGLLPAGKASQIDLLPEPYQIRAQKLVAHFGDSGISFNAFQTTPGEVAEAIGGPVDIAKNLLRHLVSYGVMSEETTHSPNSGYTTKYRWRS